MNLDPLLLTFFAHVGAPLRGDPPTLLTALLQNFARIPYENLTKIIGAAEGTGAIFKQTPEEVIQGFIAHGTGGTCFPLTETLVRLVRALGFEAHPILADRRYGTDTHCALICKLSSHPTDTVWHLIDPGYLITTPCRIPHEGSARYELPITTIELRAADEPSRLHLYTSTNGETNLKYRLTYKIAPVDAGTFHKAWERSFDWEMMTYPIISSIVGNTQVYVQKKSLLVRSATQSTRVTLTDESLIHEVATRLSLSPHVVRQALKCLR